MPELIELTWTDSGHHQMVSSRDRGPFRYQAYVPDPIAATDPSIHGAAMAQVEAAAQACSALDSSPGIDDLEPVARLLLRAESVASSRIEGLRLSHRRLEEARFEPGGARGTARAIVRNIEAMSTAIDLGSGSKALTEDGLLSIHRILMYTDQDQEIAGVVRTAQNWIGGGNTPRRAEFVPPPPDRVPALLDDLIRFTNRSDLPAVLQAAIAHAQFETIHPFADGNGRTGRCLIHLILRRRGISLRVVPPVSVVLAANAAEYVAGLTAFRDLDAATWVETFASSLRLAGERAIDLGSALSSLKQEWLDRAGDPRNGSATRLLVDGLAAHPVVSVESVQQLLPVRGEAARTAILRLEEAGVLRQVTIGKRNRAWAAIEVLDLLDDFDSLVRSPGDP